MSSDFTDEQELLDRTEQMPPVELGELLDQDERLALAGGTPSPDLADGTPSPELVRARPRASLPPPRPRASTASDRGSMPEPLPVRPRIASVPPPTPRARTQTVPPPIPVRASTSSMPPPIPVRASTSSMPPPIPVRASTSSMPPPIPTRVRATTVPPPIPMRARATIPPAPQVARGSAGLPIAPSVDVDVDIDIEVTPPPPAEPAIAAPSYVQRVAQEWPVVAPAEEPVVRTQPWFDSWDAAPASETDLVDPVELDKPRSSSLRWGVLFLLAIAVAAGAYVATRSVTVEPVAHQPVASPPVASPTAEPAPAMPVAPTPTEAPAVSQPAATAEPTPAAPTAEPTPAAPTAEPPPKVEVVKSTAAPASETRIRSSSRSSRQASEPRESTAAAKRKPAATRVAVAHAVAPKPSTRGPKGTLMISSKPPCEIVVDGVATVLVTPQRAMPLAPGKHKVTLFNDTYNINATVDIVIEPGKTTKLIKDFSAQMRRR